MDEHGIALGVCTSSRVLASSLKKRTYKKSPQTREWVTILETINAAGQIIKPLIIFKGRAPQTTWFEGDTPDWMYTTSENGWTANRIALGWLQQIYIPETSKECSRHRMLIMDGHGSHIDIEFLWLCKQHNIQLLFLPAHSSHVLQPLDLGVFSPLKTRYRKGIAELASLDDAAPVKKQRFLSLYNLARTEALTSRVIRSGWSATGLCPWNPAKGLNSLQIQQPRVTTPPLQQSQINTSIFQTPKSSQQVYQAIRKVRSRHTAQQDLSRLATKAGKAIAALNAQLAGSQHVVDLQEQQLKALSTSQTRKRVTHDPNARFASIEDIKKAKDEQAKQAARIAARQPELTAKRAAEAVLQRSMQDLQSEWQL